jgi:hypothetical protein
MNQWLVFYAKNARIGSLPLTEQNLDGMKAQFCMSLIQTDVTGTQHWEIISPWGKSPQGRMAQAEYARKYGEAALKELLAAQ